MQRRFTSGLWVGALSLALVCGATTPATAQNVGAYDAPMQFTEHANGGSCSSCAWTAAIGVITPETPELFRAHLREHGPGLTYFHSPGGNLLAALELGQILRDHRVTTAVGATVLDDPSRPRTGWFVEPGNCFSACAFAFMGGHRRAVNGFMGSAGYGNRLGVHQYYEPGMDLSLATERARAALFSRFEPHQAITALLAEYLQSMGIDQKVLGIAASTPSDRMYVFSEDEWLHFGIERIATYGAWFLEPYRNGVVAASRATEDHLWVQQATFFCRSADRKPRLLLTTQLVRASGGSTNMLEDVATIWEVRPVALTWSDGERSVISADLISGQLHTGEPGRIEYVLTEAQVTNIIQTGAVELDASLPRFLFGNLGQVRVPVEGVAADFIRAALRFCI